MNYANYSVKLGLMVICVKTRMLIIKTYYEILATGRTPVPKLRIFSVVLCEVLHSAGNNINKYGPETFIRIKTGDNVFYQNLHVLKISADLLCMCSYIKISY